MLQPQSVKHRSSQLTRTCDRTSAVILFNDCEGIEYILDKRSATDERPRPARQTPPHNQPHLPSHRRHQDPYANHSHSPRSQHTYSTPLPVADVFPLTPALVANVAILPGSTATRHTVFKIRQALKFCNTSCCIRLGALPTSVGLHLHHVSQGYCCPPSPPAYAKPSEARMTTLSRGPRGLRGVVNASVGVMLVRASGC